MKRKTDRKRTNKKEKDLIKPEGSILQFLKPKISVETESLYEEDIKSKSEENENSELNSCNSFRKNIIKIPLRQNIFPENQNLQNFQNLQKIKRDTNENYKKKIIINENFIKEFLENFSFFSEKIEKDLKNFDEKNNKKIFSKENFTKFSANIDLFVIKFFLQIEEIFIFVPNFLSNSKMEIEDLKEIEKHLFKLFEGFDNSNNYLNYQPIASKEVKKFFIFF